MSFSGMENKQRSRDIMSKTKFKYNLAGKYGVSLHEALREQDFYNYDAREAEYLLEESKIGGDRREYFISWLEATLSYLRWADYSKKADVSCEKLSDHLMTNELQNDEGELELREKYSTEYTSGLAYDVARECGDDDIEIAYTFGLIKFTDLPQDVQRKINFLCDRARKYDEKHSEVSIKLRDFSSRLERKACEKLILVEGFYCDIHEGNAEYKESIPKQEVLTCPACEHPICPVCTNMFTKDPKDIEDAREYVASCESVSGHAFCGNCGDCSVEFVLRFLKLIGCPIPPECEDFKPIPREARFCMTATVDALPNKDSILQTAITEFNKGTTGIIKIYDPSGEIWAMSERYPDGWLITILYPEER